jgi:hypothetical protein
MEYEAIRAAVRQMVREAVTAHLMIDSTDAMITPRDLFGARHARDAMVRAIAYTLGWSYYVGYDRAPATVWHDGYNGVRDVIMSASGSDTYRLDDVTRTLLTDHWQQGGGEEGH